MRLVPLDPRLADAAMAGDEALAEALGVEVVPGWVSFKEAMGSAGPGTRFFLAGEPLELVGWGGFKGPPQDGVVELGYEIAESRRCRGLATAAVHAMLAEAFADAAVSAAIAHTLPERNASNRVLEKAGFAFDGEAREDDQVVWRYALSEP